MWLLKDEIAATVRRIGPSEFAQRIFNGFHVSNQVQEALLTSLYTGHHILIFGPPGCGKTTLANRVAGFLDAIEVVSGCPVNCLPENADCPWCNEAKAEGQLLTSQTVPGSARVKRVQGSGGLVPEDLIGDIDPERAFTRGIHHIGAFVPGKLLRANRGVLLVDFIDRIPDKVLNMIIYALQGGSISIGAYEDRINLDTLVVGTGSMRALHYLPLELIDYFDVITLDYVTDAETEKRVILGNVSEGSSFLEVPDMALDIVNRTRMHTEVQRGVSTRGAIKYVELLASANATPIGETEIVLRTAARVSLPHRIEPTVESDTANKREKIIEEILDDVLGTRDAREDVIGLSKTDILALVEEIAREDKFRKPLKYGAFDLLLRRLQRFPESRIAQAHREAMQRLLEFYPERYKADNVTQELLVEIEQVRKEQKRLSGLAMKLEEDALHETLGLFEQHDILARNRTGWELSQRGLTLLLEKLMPKSEGKSHLYGYGKHSTGKKSIVGEGKIVGTRQFRFGDRYRDISLKDTLREAIRNHRSEVTREDIRVTVKDIRSKMDIVLALDLSGTMQQLEKLWYAKESAIALALAAMRYGDRVGIVTFSNLADVVVDITDRIYALTRQVINLELHENAFTNIGYGILKANQLFARRPKGDASQHIILVSDGDATAPHPSPQRYALKQAAHAARKGITVSCICINEDSADPELMRRIAQIGKGRIYLIGSECLAGTLREETLQLRH